MLLIVVLILETSATDVPVGSIGSEYGYRVIDGPKLYGLDVLQVVVDLEVEWVLGVQGVPLMGHLILCLGLHIDPSGFVDSIILGHLLFYVLHP